MDAADILRVLARLPRAHPIIPAVKRFFQFQFHVSTAKDKREDLEHRMRSCSSLGRKESDLARLLTVCERREESKREWAEMPREIEQNW